MNTERLRGLYAVTDENLIPPEEFERITELALQGGASIIQYRDKSGNHQRRQQQARALKVLCLQYEALLIINDDIELAADIQADGVHLGERDDSIKLAREVLGDYAIIGRSCYNQIELAIDARHKGADYVAFGSFYPSPTKPQARKADLGLLQEAKRQIDIPVCVIGGITHENAAPLIQAGADMAASISGIFSRPDIKQASAQLARLFDD